jgi:hypothetical protein
MANHYRGHTVNYIQAFYLPNKPFVWSVYGPCVKADFPMQRAAEGAIDAACEAAVCYTCAWKHHAQVKATVFDLNDPLCQPCYDGLATGVRVNYDDGFPLD